ncbi:MAG: SIS domain-containing protein [Lachnospirales bacterium]
MIGLNNEILKNQKAEITALEIIRQPKVWVEIYDNINNIKDTVTKMMDTINYNDKIIFTGAGSSGFIGDYMVPVLRSLGYSNVYSFHTTDIVACPKQYLFDEKTVLVSFGRSGNSPESVACINIANTFVKEISHIIITCNSKGALANISGKNVLNLQFDMLNDLAFAMTSSQSGMTLASYIIFAKDEELRDKIVEISNIVEGFMNNKTENLWDISKLDYNRFVVLGAGNLEGLAKEASLKNTELTAGKVASFYNSPLGFRHGPKCQVDKDTIVVFLASNNEYTKKYDLDMIKELHLGESKKLVVISDVYEKEYEKFSDIYYFASSDRHIDNGLLNLFYLPICQIIALQHSVFMGITSDNPFPSGALNRVVAGVTIYDL